MPPQEFEVLYPTAIASEIVVVRTTELNWNWSEPGTFGCETTASTVIAEELQKVHLTPSESELSETEPDDEALELRSLPTPVESFSGRRFQVRVSVASGEFARRVRGRPVPSEASGEEEPE
jgi:hypothetical protein